MSDQKKKCEEKGKLLNEKTGRCICHRNEKTGRCITPEIPVAKRPVGKKKSDVKNNSEQKRKCEEKGKLLNEETGRCICHRNEKTGRCITPEIPVKIKTPKTSPKSPVKARKTSSKSPVKKRKTSPKSPVKARKTSSKSPVKKIDPDVIFGKGGIESVSGPVSFYYLRPTKQVYNDGNGQYFPLIVLFGDAHFSLANTCNPCVCKDKKRCCYKLSDPDFLRKLDTLSDPEHPVDFFTETLVSSTEMGFFKGGGMMHDLTSENMISCYHHRFRGTLYDKCPTKNIRWQAGETRYLPFINDNIYTGFDPFIRDLYQNQSNVPKMDKTTWTEQEFSTILKQFGLLATNIDVESNKKVIDRSFNKFRAFNTVESLQRLLMTLCENDHDDNTLNFNAFSKALFRLLGKGNSLIYKQIAKQRYEQFQSADQWRDFYRRGLESSSKYRDYPSKQMLRIIIIKLPGLLYHDLKFSQHETYYLRILNTSLTSPLVDIYTIARIWKQPTGGILSSLSFGYFGNNHVDNMVNLLMSTNAYELVYHNLKTNVSNLGNVRVMFALENLPLRCQTFDFTLNLSEEIREHNRKIK